MHCSGMPPEGPPGDDLSRHWMRSLRPRSHARFAHDDDRAASITGLNRALIANSMGRSCPPNAWRISRAAPIGWERLHAMIARIIGTISLDAQRRRAACAGWAAPRRRHALTCQPCWRSRAFPVMASEGVSLVR
jgi:hypothetical protein